jgi:hypothetical protein
MKARLIPIRSKRNLSQIRIQTIALAIAALAGHSGLQMARAQSNNLSSLSTAFSYQGRLTVGTNVANGSYDLRYSLFATNVGGSPLAGPLTNTGVLVSNGLFTTYVDFGPGVFTGYDSWLEVAARPTDTLSFTTISPRQRLVPVPYAQYAPVAGSISGLQIQLNGTSPNVIGGSSSNSVAPGVVGAFIGGGGAVGQANSVSGWYGTVSGGAANAAFQAYSVIGGGLQNFAQGVEATVAGGGANNAAANSSTVGGGTYNTANGIASTIGGGYNNATRLNYGAVVGGENNFATGHHTFIGGGAFNVASNYDSIVGGLSNRISADFSFVANGEQNVICENGPFSGHHSFIVGGGFNVNCGSYSGIVGGLSNANMGDFSIIGGGDLNWIQTNATFCTIGGGESNLIQTSAVEGTIPGGSFNQILSTDASTNADSTIGGGLSNTIETNASFSTIGGGAYNTIGSLSASNSVGTNKFFYSVISGGQSNQIQAAWATIPGGSFNSVGDQNGFGGQNSLAAGHRAKVYGNGTFAWADSIESDFTSYGYNQFLIRASGGVGIGTVSPGAQLEVAGDIYAGTAANGGSIRFRRNDGATAAAITSDPANTDLAILSVGGGSRVRIQGHPASGYVTINPDGGNVGIRTANPDMPLTVNGEVKINPNGSFYGLYVSSPGASGVGVVADNAGSGQAGVWGNAVFDGTGVLGQSETGNGVQGTTSAGYGVFGQRSPVAGTSGWGGLFRYGTDGNNSAYLGGYGHAAMLYGTVYMSSDCFLDGYYWCKFGGNYYALDKVGPGNQPTVWNNTPSDQRLKRDITTIPSALETVEKLRGVTWYWNETGLEHLTRDIEKKWMAASGKAEDNEKLWQEKRSQERQRLSKREVGFVAQEVEQVFPDWVSSDEQGYKRINMERLSAVLVNAIKEQQAQIQAQEKEIAELRAAQRQASEEWESRFTRLQKALARLADSAGNTFATHRNAQEEP